MIQRTTGFSLSAAEFLAIRDKLYQVSGINLQAGKEGLVQTRLSTRLRQLGIESFAEYLELVAVDPSGSEFAHLVDLLTTNKTSFFREAPHFDLMRNQVLPALFEARGPIRIWSAGCSSGEEPYTLASVIEEVESGRCGRDARILATDLSSRVLARARAAVYEEAMVEGMAPEARKRMLEAVEGEPGRFRVRASLRARVTLARLNLMEPWPMRGPFQVIFCRNVMIYFDRTLQSRVFRLFSESLPVYGILALGSKESLRFSGVEEQYEALDPREKIYRKVRA